MKAMRLALFLLVLASVFAVYQCRMDPLIGVEEDEEEKMNLMGVDELMGKGKYKEFKCKKQPMRTPGNYFCCGEGNNEAEAQQHCYSTKKECRYRCALRRKRAGDRGAYGGGGNGMAMGGGQIGGGEVVGGGGGGGDMDMGNGGGRMGGGQYFGGAERMGGGRNFGGGEMGGGQNFESGGVGGGQFGGGERMGGGQF